MLRSLRAEFLKLRRARMLLWTALTVAVAPAVAAGGVQLGDRGISDTTWESFLHIGPQMMASWWGVLLFGLAASFLFGREFTDGTAKNMLTLPIRREAFVFAKLIVLAVWVLGLVGLSVVLHAAYAAVLGLPGFAWSHVWVSLGETLRTAVLIYLTLPVVASLAMLEKGYLPPMLFSGFMATASFMVGAVGWGRWFPWSMPLAVAGSSFGPLFPAPVLVPASWAIDAVLFWLGVVVMLVYIDRADNTQ
jgi:ABC-2 type transport system permease protein